jgi:hypothetical protein
MVLFLSKEYLRVDKNIIFSDVSYTIYPRFLRSGILLNGLQNISSWGSKDLDSGRECVQGLEEDSLPIDPNFPKLFGGKIQFYTDTAAFLLFCNVDKYIVQGHKFSFNFSSFTMYLCLNVFF